MKFKFVMETEGHEVQLCFKEVGLLQIVAKFREFLKLCTFHEVAVDKILFTNLEKEENNVSITDA